MRVWCNIASHEVCSARKRPACAVDLLPQQPKGWVHLDPCPRHAHLFSGLFSESLAADPSAPVPWDGVTCGQLQGMLLVRRCCGLTVRLQTTGAFNRRGKDSVVCWMGISGVGGLLMSTC